MAAQGTGVSTSTSPDSVSREIIIAVSTLLTLATTIGESDVVSAPSMVLPDARLSTRRPSRITVIVTAGLALARSSNARLAKRISGSGSGSTGGAVVVVLVVVVVVLLVVVVLVVVLVVVVLVLVVVVLVVVVVVVVVAAVVGGTVVVEVVEGAVDAELAVDWPPQALAISSPATASAIDALDTWPR